MRTTSPSTPTNPFAAEDRRLSYWKKYNESWARTHQYFYNQLNMSHIIQYSFFIELLMILVGFFIFINPWLFSIPPVPIIFAVINHFILDRKMAEEDNLRENMRINFDK